MVRDQILVLLYNQAERLRLNELNPPQSCELHLLCLALLRARRDHIFRYERPQELELPSPLFQHQELLASMLEPRLLRTARETAAELNPSEQNRTCLEQSS